MLFRSILFYVFLSFWTIFMGIFCMPFLFLPKRLLERPIRFWILGIFFSLKYICKITHEIQGSENIPKESVLIVSKHQSAFETFALYYYLPNSIFIHKKQLFFIPIFGQYLKKINMIAINRKGGANTIRTMLKEAKQKINLGISIIIFPEGTRKKPHAKPDYKTGFISIYKELKKEILPVAVNSGNFWPKNFLIKSKGNIIIKILPTIKPNLERKKILLEVIKKIEDATNQII